MEFLEDQNDLMTSREDQNYSKASQHYGLEDKNYFEKITDSHQIENSNDVGLKKLTER